MARPRSYRQNITGKRARPRHGWPTPGKQNNVRNARAKRLPGLRQADKNPAGKRRSAQGANVRNWRECKQCRNREGAGIDATC